MYRILVVDDEPMIRKGLEKLISQTAGAGIVVETAENGEPKPLPGSTNLSVD